MAELLRTLQITAGERDRESKFELFQLMLAFGGAMGGAA